MGEATTAPLCKTCGQRHWGTCWERPVMGPFIGSVMFGPTPRMSDYVPPPPLMQIARDGAVGPVPPKPGEVCPCCGERKPSPDTVTKPRNETPIGRQGGRPKKHADGAARARAHRQRTKAKGSPAP